MRGLKKRKTTEFKQRHATPISLAMLRVLHNHLNCTNGFTDASRLWFCAVSAFAFYGMCRINEVLSLQWKNLEGRKTEVAEGRCYNIHHLVETERPIDALFHLTAWLTYVQDKTDHRWSDSDYVFPALSKISKTVLKTDSALTGCENVRVEWGKKMSEQAFISLLNWAVRDLNRNGQRIRGYIRQEWRDIWFTSHTFRRAGAQYRFMFAAQERRWSLRMVKWWAGWTQNESAETLVRYLLDQTASDEDNQLADCLAPDRDTHTGCPTTYSGKKRNVAVAEAQSSALEKRMKKVEESLRAVEDKIDLLISVLRPTQGHNPMPTTTEQDDEDKTSALPPAKDWKDLFYMYWKEDSSRHLFKPVCQWTNEEQKKSGALPSRLSVTTLIGNDVAEFAAQRGIANPAVVEERTLSEYAAYYKKYWLEDGASTSLDVLTIDTLARFIRLDRKRRVSRSCHAYLNGPR
ncbi:hypothetical protein PF005_g12776 [Phytophthora fragariae]|uniref:Tyr recombinase domain-containing protein n=1 Tax=Phytophthora fragariae TaxID=53985 RepID=A0A6A3YC01_9STRA|nr:hypothetical protein PF006_g17303 [Phytophthora fragariae]KAE9207035.1 hypothetical protein PF005_g12776 [Phytophthora fragariae]KAE9216019.1 hypothetical protein PF002_g17210 [Phytophthora fragariae]